MNYKLFLPLFTCLIITLSLIATPTPVGKAQLIAYLGSRPQITQQILPNGTCYEAKLPNHTSSATHLLQVARVYAWGETPENCIFQVIDTNPGTQIAIEKDPSNPRQTRIMTTTAVELTNRDEESLNVRFITTDFFAILEELYQQQQERTTKR